MAATSITAIVRDYVGRRHSISREEMIDLLIVMGRAGLPLENSHVPDTYDLAPVPGQTYQRGVASSDPTRAARAWAEKCSGITCVSVKLTGLRDGYVRYDSPGGMDPQQQADVTFAPATLRANNIDYLRERASRVLLVKD